ncbi:CvpA family protein [Pelistega ratti]|uniref:CvpA family protein n=1 Tax=Pelistega ratti TaxID=2652177 RepID=UPI00135B837C|nr:CvpA family protein [Pelistega ratti]
MTEFDYIFLAVLGASGILGFMRGFLKEAFSLVAYIAAGCAAAAWGPHALPWFSRMVDNIYISIALSYAVVFIAVLLIIGLINKTLSSVISQIGLGSADSILGLFFGLVRGLIIVLVVVILLGYTDMPQAPWWQNAKFSGVVIEIVHYLKTFVPSDMVKYLPY